VTRDPLWYKDGIFYELRVRSFFDSNDDGIGDFGGLASKLDYLQDLGVTAIWLLPFYPSPLRDDGYDISDYTDVHPDVGTLDDFRHFLAEAHRRGLRVITELVLNHTSDQHPWFQRARRAPPGSPERAFYVWADDAERYKDARVIFKDFEPSNWSWDPVAKQYFWHRFYAHQPDLNFENPEVKEALFRAVDFWLEMGVDGLRLDAVPYLYEEDGTNCENLPKTHALLKELRAHIDARFEDRMLLAEANQWPEDAAAYFGAGDECHMNFHFPIMPRMFMSLHMEDRLPIVDILEQTPALHPSCQWAIFLRNHDELTLEMVTEEEREYMYRAYAHEARMRLNLGIRRRLAPLVGNDRRKVELLNGLLFSMPGTPVVYYGDEIGMGDNVYLGDRNGVRTPMQWTMDRNAGFSRANPQQLILPVIIDPEYHYESLNVEAQQDNPSSLLWWTKRLVELRKRYAAFGRGSVEFLNPANPRVLAFVREWGEQTILVVANLSRFVQYVELDLGKHKGGVPVELFGHNEFPSIGELPYLLTLGAHAFYWFSIERRAKVDQEARHSLFELATIDCAAPGTATSGEDRDALEAVLPAFLESRRWFGGGERRVTAARVTEALPLVAGTRPIVIAFVAVEYGEGEPETYIVPLGFAPEGPQEPRPPPNVLVAQVRVRGEVRGVIFEAIEDAAAARALLAAIVERSTIRGEGGELLCSHTPGTLGEAPLSFEPRRVGLEHANAIIQYGERFVLKMLRKREDGTSPEVEIGRFLAARGPQTIAPALLGVVEYKVGRREPQTVAVLSRFVPNEGTAWRHSVEAVRRYYERVLATAHDPPARVPEGSPLLHVDDDPPADVRERMGAYLELSTLLARRTAELHLALASDPDDPAFAPAPSTMLDQRSVYQSVRSQATQVMSLLRMRLPASVQADAKRVLSLEGELMGRLKALIQQPITATRIRTHGDYHLGQVLWTGGDFIIIDFEGEPARPLADRRLKRWPLRDVAGMLRSFDYAAHSAHKPRRSSHPASAKDWLEAVSRTYLAAYYATAGSASFLPPDDHSRSVLLGTFLLEKALYEVRYELNNRPDWVRIPLRGILGLMGIED
jgi:maltose alpha-D-glucosyltransferase/alpha-amylase